MATKKQTVEIEYKGIKLSVAGVYYPEERDTNSASAFDIHSIAVHDSFEDISALISDEDWDWIVECVISVID